MCGGGGTGATFGLRPRGRSGVADHAAVRASADRSGSLRIRSQAGCLVRDDPGGEGVWQGARSEDGVRGEGAVHTVCLSCIGVQSMCVESHVRLSWSKTRL